MAATEFFLSLLHLTLNFTVDQEKLQANASFKSSEQKDAQPLLGGQKQTKAMFKLGKVCGVPSPPCGHPNIQTREVWENHTS